MRVLLKDSEEHKSTIDADAVLAKVSPPQLSRNPSSNEKVKGTDLRTLPAVTPFLGVQGLSRTKLDECVEAFFQRLGPCMPLSQNLAVFWPRYHLFLDVACGTSTQDYMSIEPASELLVLAVACRGCGNTGLSDRLELLGAISDRFVVLANAADNKSLLSLDGIEAVNLISERVVRPLYPQSEADCSSPLRIDILGRSSGIELALLSNLNVAPPKNPGQVDDVRDRTGFIFWTVFAHDAFRSVAARRMYRIHEEDIGWVAPDKVTRMAIFPDYGRGMYTLALVARGISRDLLSIRAKRDGLSRSTLLDTVARLNSWHEELDEPLKFKWSHDGTFASFDDDYNGVDLQARRSFMLTIWLSLYLQVWASLPTRTSIEISDEDTHLESEILQAYFRMASLARYCQQHDLADCAPNELRNVPAAWSLWYACYIRRAAGLYINIAAQRIDQMNQACHALVDCVRSARSSEDSGELAARLVDTIAQALALAEQRLFRGGNNSNNKMVGFDTHSDLIMRAADEGMPAFKSSSTFRPAVLDESTFDMPFVDSGYDYQAVDIDNALSFPLPLHQVPPPFDDNFLDMDMQDFLNSCGIEASLYMLV